MKRSLQVLNQLWDAAAEKSTAMYEIAASVAGEQALVVSRIFPFLSPRAW
jgi:hypothetical protein